MPKKPVFKVVPIRGGRWRLKMGPRILAETYTKELAVEMGRDLAEDEHGRLIVSSFSRFVRVRAGPSPRTTKPIR